MCELRYLLMQVNKRPGEFRRKKTPQKTVVYKSAEGQRKLYFLLPKNNNYKQTSYAL